MTSSMNFILATDSLVAINILLRCQSQREQPLTRAYNALYIKVISKLGKTIIKQQKKKKHWPTPDNR